MQLSLVFDKCFHHLRGARRRTIRHDDQVLTRMVPHDSRSTYTMLRRLKSMSITRKRLSKFLTAVLTFISAVLGIYCGIYGFPVYPTDSSFSTVLIHDKAWFYDGKQFIRTNALCNTAETRSSYLTIGLILFCDSDYGYIARKTIETRIFVNGKYYNKITWPKHTVWGIKMPWREKGDSYLLPIKKTLFIDGKCMIKTDSRYVCARNTNGKCADMDMYEIIQLDNCGDVVVVNVPAAVAPVQHLADEQKTQAETPEPERK